ncbi:NADP-dependent oxidoreductase [Homoserinimonas aerilata]
MRAAVIDGLGGPEVLHLVRAPLPSPQSGEVLVRVRSAALNPIDTKTRAGKGASGGITSYPLTLGNDFSGTVVQAIDDEHPLQPGTEVYGMLSVPLTGGSYAEYAAVPITAVGPIPHNLRVEDAAAVPLAALTAQGALREGGVTAASRVLIHAGAGGVGHFAVQLAAIAGAEVITTASARNADWLRSLGAEQVIDYRETRFEDALDGIDVVIDLIGNVHDYTATRSLRVLRPGGTIVNVPTRSWPTMAEEAEAAGVRATGYRVTPDAANLAEITALIEEGRLTVNIDARFPLEQIAEAHRLLEEGHTRGKIVIDVG